MSTLLTRRQALALMSAGCAAPWLGAATALRGADQREPEHRAAYGLEFSGSVEELIGDLVHSERGDPHRESLTAYDEWYSHETRRRLHAWGPKPRLYPPLAGLDARPTQWKRERVVATAARFLGYGYQHHHIPDWDPPPGWPWNESCMGHNGKGVDCSNLTSFVFNQGFGIKFSSDIGRQARTDHAIEAGRPLRIARVDLPTDYAGRKEVLCTGDLVYIRGREDRPITHVVIWVGSVGRAASGLSLVIDSHGSGVTDDAGKPIPCGVQLRPFRQGSWYDRCASHAHRIFA
jgi:cell wall-associated NlpC family hydrolase